MRKVVFVIFAFFFAINLHAQSAEEVDSIVKTYPKITSSVVRLSERIKKDFTTEYGKARAIYTWIALNIGYDDQFRDRLANDTSFVYKGKSKQIDDSVINQVLVKRKAVCDGYSRLFNRLATLAGLESEIIIGTAKTSFDDIGNTNLTANHAWNSVKIDGTWRLIDVTWGSGCSVNGLQSVKGFTPFYFDTPSELFFLKHYPQKGNWLDKIVEKEVFVNSPLFYLQDDNINFRIIEPNLGTLSVASGKKIKFVISNLKSDNDITIKTDLLDEIAIIDKKTTENTVEFDILLDKNAGKQLVVFIDGKGFVEYRLTFL